MKNYLLRQFQNLTCPSYHQTESVEQSVATSDVTEPSQSSVEVIRVSTSRDIVTRSEGTTISYSSVSTAGGEKGVVSFSDKPTTKETGFSSAVMNRVALSTSKEGIIPSSTSRDYTSSSEEEDSFFSKEFYDDFNKKGYSVVAATPSNRPVTKTNDADYDYDDSYDEEQAEGVDDANDEADLDTVVEEEEKTMSQVVRSVSNPDYLEVGGTVLEGSRSALHTPRHVAEDDVISGRSSGSRRLPSWGTAVIGVFLLGMCIFCT
jgi:hypothetical protein